MAGFFAWSAALTSCESKQDGPAPAGAGPVDIEFENVVGSAPLQLNNSTPYTTPAGDQFTVATLRYYISNIKLKKADGTEYVQPESYYLIDQERLASQRFTIANVPAGTYTGLTFTLGVDAARNVAGAQTGALAPSDMFWDWTSGYIFTKLEGRSPSRHPAR
ncbi:MbnP family protein [Hymenobacter humi]|uniref:MbnP family protein n=1 Tax=Hymenobacter humi TaxID=1411620 RepID=A0ABW2UAX9_9BACT